MTEIPLEGFLLTPVQKICKYHLQLAELLKYTASDHPDYPHVRSAVEAMKKIAKLVNERKRKMESIETLAEWQMLVDDWEVSEVACLLAGLVACLLVGLVAFWVGLVGCFLSWLGCLFEGWLCAC